MDFYKHIVRPVIFHLDPDLVHERTIRTGYLLGRTAITRKALELLFDFKHPSLGTEVFGIHFNNPVGIAGGFDKDCRLIQTLPFVGFGFTEVGSITAKPYAGNSRPWNVRLVEEKSILVNYGLKNAGVDILSKRISKEKRSVPLVINIAKTNDPGIKGDDSVEDYNTSFVKLQPLADIVNLNVSCPNSGDGQLFCESPELLEKLLRRIGKNKITKPVVLKLKPDLDDKMLDKILAVIRKYPFVKGFIISNLTRNRSLLKVINPQKIQDLPGGLSGKPVQRLSTEMIRKVYKKTKGKYIIIGVGGIFNAADAYEKICAGASLVEIATGLIYGGPATVKRINQGLVDLIKKDGLENVAQAVGSKT